MPMLCGRVPLRHVRCVRYSSYVARVGYPGVEIRGLAAANNGPHAVDPHQWYALVRTRVWTPSCDHQAACDTTSEGGISDRQNPMPGKMQCAQLLVTPPKSITPEFEEKFKEAGPQKGQSQYKWFRPDQPSHKPLVCEFTINTSGPKASFKKNVRLTFS